ncbi:MerR family transcriptional regulator [Streptomyces virginiae]|uniref:MerR family transcriptional regulator n=1 Tax=Streptomyces virginiae TaxID=1961 RepID=UPI00364DABAD
MSALRISQLAERSGVPASTLRFYETAGLLPAERTPSGYRRYGERLGSISSAKCSELPPEPRDHRLLRQVRSPPSVPHGFPPGPPPPSALRRGCGIGVAGLPRA